MELQREMYRNMIEEPEELEAQINDLADQVATKFVFRPDQTVKIEFNDVHYELKMARTIMDFKRVFLLVAMDKDNGKLIKSVGECDNKLSDQENYRAMMAAFLRDRCGLVPEASELED